MTMSLDGIMPEEEFESYGYPPIPVDVEDIDMYRPGGFHPVIVGDVLGDRFQVIQKLGHGGFATVWLCHDKLDKQWKAVKVVVASHSDERTSSELSILKYFEGVTDEELERNHICLPRNNFFIDGPNGRHLCIVMPVLGRSAHDFWLDFGSDVDFTREVSTQMTEALDFLHSKGVCHGDFRPRNILFKLGLIDQLSFDRMMSMFPKTCRLPVPPPPSTMEGPGPHLPKYIYQSASLRPPVGLTTREILVSDFGEAYHVSEPPNSTGIPLDYAAPEVILPSKTPSLDFGADIWALGQTICELRLGTVILPTFDTFDYFSTTEQMLGPLPEPYRTVWIERGYEAPGLPPASEIPLTHPMTMTPDSMARYREERLEDTGFGGYLESAVRSDSGYGCTMKPGEVLRPNESDVGDNQKWVSRIVPEQEADRLLDLLTKIFKYDPTERLSASGILAHPWFEPEKHENFVDYVMDEDYDDMYDPMWEPETRVPGEDVDVEMDDEEIPDEKDPAQDIVAPSVAPQTREDGSEDAFFDAEAVHQGNPAIPRQNWLLAWFAWVVRVFIPRMYGGPMSLGGLRIYR